jgi:RHS repeat-associated protein
VRRLAITALSWLALVAHARAADVVRYYHADAVGNVRAVTDGAGAVIERHDYLPFGEEWNPTAGTQPRRFAGKERDRETGLDYFGGRYYGARLGRFTTSDPAYTIADNLGDPQRWNRYAYGRNNPLRYVDPDGRVIFDYQEFKGYLTEAGSFGKEGYGYLVPAASALAAAGSVASDALLLIGVGEVIQGVRGGLAATSVARTGLGLTDDAGRLIVTPQAQLAQGVSPSLVVPDAYKIVRGGQGAVPPPGTTFSGGAGASTTEAAGAVPHGTIRQTTAGAIREQGGRVVLKPEATRAGRVNTRHVNVTEGGKTTSFGEATKNPVPSSERIQ